MSTHYYFRARMPHHTSDLVFGPFKPEEAEPQREWFKRTYPEARTGMCYPAGMPHARLYNVPDNMQKYFEDVE